MAQSPLQQTIHTVIFGTDTPAGKLFDLILIYLILISVGIMALDTVSEVQQRLGVWLVVLEWSFTILFTLEYAVRIYCSPKRWQYVRSFYGVVDLLAIVPAYLGIFFGGANYLLMVRLLRVLRVFRILKLVRYLDEANILLRAMIMSRRKIFVFFSSVLVLCVLIGSLMYVVEGAENGFTSIPKSIYWTIVTITTVGYGDIAPQTSLGQFIAAGAMLTGYSILAVPTGILTAELAMEIKRDKSSRVCNECDKSGHEVDSSHCRFCGERLHRADSNRHSHS